MVLGVRYQYFGEDAVTFPIIFKEKRSQVKERLQPLVVVAFTRALTIAKYFYPGYMVATLALRSDPQPHFLVLLDLPLLLLVVTSCSFLLLTTATRHVVFSTFATEPLALDLAPLLASLEPSCPPLLRLLLLQRLSLLSCRCPLSRTAILSLSQPGGHPHTWDSVLAHCSKEVQQVTTALSPAPAPPPASKAQEPAPLVASPAIRRLAPASLAPRVEELRAPAPPLLQTLVSERLKSLESQPLLSSLFSPAQDYAARSALCRAQVTAPLIARPQTTRLFLFSISFIYRNLFIW